MSLDKHRADVEQYVLNEHAGAIHDLLLQEISAFDNIPTLSVVNVTSFFVYTVYMVRPTIPLPHPGLCLWWLRS